MMKKYNFWFVVGTQHLYGEEIFETIKVRAEQIATFLNQKIQPFATIEFKSLLKTQEEITQFSLEANHTEDLAGIITWMHTFSPSKMWINGLNLLQKPVLHLHTQFNQEIPWNQIDMDFMNLNQAAHGDREHGHIFTKMKKYRKIVAGYYQDEDVVQKIKNRTRSAAGVLESRQIKVVRFGDNMRNVAVTEGDKVSAQMTFGWSVNTFGIGDLATMVHDVSQNELREQIATYQSRYDFNQQPHASIEYQAKIEVAIKKFLTIQKAKAFTTTFEDLYGLDQLPGLAVQDLMADGYGFGAEGDWKTSALLRIVKLMANGTSKGVSFMEDYTYHFQNKEGLVLGSHMLEVCPSISSEKPKLLVKPLSIGGKNPPARAVFNAKTGKALQLSIVDLGNRYRMIATECEAISPLEDMPNLPVARAMWRLLPDFQTATEAWLLSGGAHHTVMVYDLDISIFNDFAEMFGIEFVHIGSHTKITDLKRELAMADIIYGLKGL
jgi:L-arabinose isomerase